MTVTAIRATMERERAAAALAGAHVVEADRCAIIVAVLKAALCAPHGSRRPWAFGTAMVGPTWLFGSAARIASGTCVLAYVVRSDHDAVACAAWTRKAHRAWRHTDVMYSVLAPLIFSGLVTDPFIYSDRVTDPYAADAP